jgi:hypothetical protein
MRNYFALTLFLIYLLLIFVLWRLDYCLLVPDIRLWYVSVHVLDIEGTLSMTNGVFWVVTPCGSCKNRRFRGT